jgi:hypothetical protein
MCKSRDLRFRAPSHEIGTCHLTLGGVFGERIDEWRNLTVTDGYNPDFYK